MKDVFSFVFKFGIGLLVLAFVSAQVHSCQEIKRLESSLLQTQDEAVIWRDKFQRSNAEIAVLQLDKKTFKRYNAQLSDSLKKAGIKIKNLQGLVGLTKHTTDTVRLVHNHYVDRWTTIQLLDSNRIAYQIRDSLSLITHYKRYGFLNLKSKYVVRAIAHNPNTTLAGLTSTEVRPKSRKLNIGIYTGYGLTLSKEVNAGFQVGIGIQYKIF